MDVSFLIYKTSFAKSKTKNIIVPMPIFNYDKLLTVKIDWYDDDPSISSEINDPKINFAD